MGFHVPAPVYFTNFRLQRGLNPGPGGRLPRVARQKGGSLQQHRLVAALAGTDFDDMMTWVWVREK